LDKGSFVEFIGFLISILALVYLFLKQRSLSRYRREHPEVFKHEELAKEEEEGDSFKEIIQSMKNETVTKPRPPPHPKVVPQPKKEALASTLKDYQLASQIEKRELKSSLENRYLKTKLVQRFDETPSEIAHPSHLEEGTKPRVEVALARLSRRRDLIIYQEIIDKPKSMRPLP
jgi:hypothetical protein